MSSLESLVSGGTHGRLVFSFENALLSTRIRARSLALAAFRCTGLMGPRELLRPSPPTPFPPHRRRRPPPVPDGLPSRSFPPVVVVVAGGLRLLLDAVLSPDTLSESIPLLPLPPQVALVLVGRAVVVVDLHRVRGHTRGR